MSTDGAHLVVFVSTSPGRTWERFLDDLAREVKRAHGAPSLLAQPVRVVVSSAVLREAVAAALTRRLGGCLGVEISTVWGLARSILAADGERVSPSSLFYTVVQGVLEGLASDNPLRDLTAASERAWRAVAASVRQLLDAGFEPHLAEVLREQLEAAGLPTPLESRARAVVDVAADAIEAAREVGALPRSEVYRRAQQVLEKGTLAGAGSRDPRPLFVYGFADVTTPVRDFFGALFRAVPARVYLDEPHDPADPEPGPDRLAARFGRRWREWLTSHPAAHVERDDGPAARVAPLPSCVAHGGWKAASAADPATQWREVAWAIAGLIENEHVAPEDILVVARRLDAATLMQARRIFDEQGIPWTAPSLPPRATPAGRALVAVGRLLREGPDAPVDIWLDALPPSADAGAWPGRMRRERARRALKRAGATTVGVAADLGIDTEVRGARIHLGTRWAPDGDGDEHAAHRDVVSPQAMEPVWDAAREFVDTWKRMQAVPKAPLRDWLASIDEILRRVLGWRRGDGDLLRPLDDARRQVPERLEVTWRQAVSWVGDALADVGASPGGGRSGVRLLTAEQARGVPARATFLVDVLRGVFPRIVREDPVLPDGARRVLRAVLPDLALQFDALAEERYLFDHLVGMPGCRVLVWPRTDGAGQPLTRSVFVDRLALAQTPAGQAVRQAASWPGPFPLDRAARGVGPEPHERWWDPLDTCAWVGCRVREPSQWNARLLEFIDPRVALPGISPKRLAAHRQGVLDALEGRKVPVLAARWGPWYGAVGPWPQWAAQGGGAVWVTRLEDIARCPWRAWLRHGLRLEPAVDLDLGVPAVPPVVTGRTMHRLVELVVAPGAAPGQMLGDADAVDATASSARRSTMPPTLARVVEAGPSWPPPRGQLGAWAVPVAAAIAYQELRDEGVPHAQMLAPVVATKALALANTALAELHARAAPGPAGVRVVRTALPAQVYRPRRNQAPSWHPPITGALGVEVTGEVPGPFGHGVARVDFRADLVLALAQGGVLLVDLKSGKPAIDGKQASTVRGNFERAFLGGTLLQAAAYASAMAPGTGFAAGAYLYAGARKRATGPRLVRAEGPLARRGTSTSSGNGADVRAVLPETFREVVEGIAGLCAHGLALPRLEAPGQPKVAPPEAPEAWPQNAACQYCEYDIACIRGDSAHRRKLRQRAWMAWLEWSNGGGTSADQHGARLWRGNLTRAT